MGDTTLITTDTDSPDPSASLSARLLSWASKLPDWQRDLCARLAEAPELSADELAEVRDNLLASSGGPPTSHAIREPSAGSFQEPAATGAPRIRALEGVQNVNALAAGRRLEFQEDGLTVVYGENASGKTGYCRIFKRVCRAIDKDAPLLRNVFQPPTSEPQKATFEVVDAAGKVSPVEIDLGAEPPEGFSAISVFDAECADNYVTEENTIAFTPEPLLIFDRMVRAQNTLRDMLTARIEALEAGAPDLDEFDAQTKIGAAVRSLSAATKPDDVRAAAELDDDARKRLAELRGLQDADPGEVAKRAARAEAEARGVNALADGVKAIESVLGDEPAQRLADLDKAADQKAKAAEVARAKAFDEQPILGVGDAVWSELWEAARRFHEHANGDGTFPPAAHGELCPLCLQGLGEDALERLLNFEEYVKSTTSAEAKAAAEAARSARARLQPSLLDACRSSVLESLRAEEPELAKRLDDYVEVAGKRLDALAAAESADTSKLVALLESPEADLTTYAAKRVAHASTLRNDKTMAAARDELRELEAAENLAKRLDPIISWIEKLKEIEVMRKAISALHTRGLTTKQNALADEVITDALRSALRAELRALGLEDVSISLDRSGALGNTVLKLTFEGKAAGNSPEQVLSKGEQRAAALAFFLAEVGVGGGDGGIVLDDPVSSLDDPRRRSVAGRLAEEAKARQVTVFTHDLVFFVRMSEIAEDDDDLPYGVQRVWRGSDEVGLVYPDAPWPGTNVKKRIGYLRRRIDDFPKAEELGPDRFAREIKSWYEELRETWERAVEEVLFGDVVQRFRPSVETQRLKRAADLTAERREAVKKGMDRCSAFAHDEAAAGEMTKEKLAEDLEELTSFVDDIRKSQNQ